MVLKIRSSSLSISHLASTSALLCLLVACLVSLACHANQEEANLQDLHLNEPANRQYFKLHLVPGVKAKPKSKFIRRAADQRTTATAAAAAGADGDELIKLAAADKNKGQQREKQSPVARQKATTISNATLKKLLNQTLLKSAAASNNSVATDGLPLTKSGQKASKNFKFVFIQRATVAPHLKTSAQASSSPPPPTTSPKEQSSAQSQEATPKASSSLLAASVSKQLATSLLNSAAGLVANLSSSASLSSLASQIVVAASDSIISNKSSSQADLSTAAATQPSSVAAAPDTARRDNSNNISSETGSPVTPAPRKVTQTRKGTKSKQAKIYNLPVKFVANGQPNHVAVFNTLKEHFATIKRLQALGAANGVGGGAKTIVSAAGSRLMNKERKQQQQQQQRHKHAKGTNSRLIYLPLRYLSNARAANKIMITSAKAAHKSGSNSNS